MKLRVQAALPFEPAQVLLQPLVPGHKPLMLGGRESHLIPVCSEFSGQLILIEQYEEQPGFLLDGDFSGGQSVHVMAPFHPEPSLKALWLGRLQTQWPGEPEIVEIRPILSQEESQLRRDLSLSEFLHGLFATNWIPNPVTIHFGTSASLTALQACCQKRQLLSRRFTNWPVVEALIGLQQSQEVLRQHAPFLQMLIEEAQRECDEEQQRVTGERDRVREELESVRLRLESEERHLEAALAEIERRRWLIETWFDDASDERVSND